MTKKPNEQVERELLLKEWLAARKRAALEIDPLTAEVMWDWVQIMDPYGVDPDLPEELQCIGRAYFARNPGSEIWVSYDDLSVEIVTKLRESGRERRAQADAGPVSVGLVSPS